MTERLRRFIAFSIISLVLFSTSVSTSRMAPGLLEDCITIDAPQTAEASQEFEFTVQLSNGSTVQSPRYQWRLSAGRIVRGQGTPTIGVIGHAGQRIKATVRVSGLKSTCRNEATSNDVKIVTALPNMPPSISSLTVPTINITLPCPPRQTSASCPTRPQTDEQVKTTASDPDGDTLLYSYSVTGGQIIGEGANVTWDLAGLGPGTYRLTVEVSDGKAKVSQAVTVTIAECPDCKPSVTNR
jgi:hypothetical protein